MQINILNNLDKKTETSVDIEERALLSGIVKSVGTMTLSKSGLGLELIFGEHEAAIFTSNLLKKLTKKEISLQKNSQTIGKNLINTFVITVNDENLTTVLVHLGLLNLDEDAESPFVSGMPSFVDNVELLKCYVRGVFLSKGKISVPDKDNAVMKDSNSYRLEVRYLPEQAAIDICAKMQQLEIHLKKKGEGDSAIIFSTESETICDLLAFIGASKAVIDINNTKIEKGVKLQAIRETNCDVANITKSVDLTEKLRSAVETLIGLNKYSELSKEMRDTCAIKLESPEFSLEQIASILNVSKSAVNHRFRKIIELAKNI